MKIPIVDRPSTLQIFQILGQTRLLSENILDKAPICFFIVGAGSPIYRSSESAANLIKIDKEWALEGSLKRLFSEGEWRVFQQQML